MAMVYFSLISNHTIDTHCLKHDDKSVGDKAFLTFGTTPTSPRWVVYHITQREVLEFYNLRIVFFMEKAANFHKIREVFMI